MVDRALFTAMSGEKSSMEGMQIAAANLANVNTPGYRADYPLVASHVLDGNSAQNARVLSYDGSTYSDFEPGPIGYTGNSLDVAISGEGFIAVQNKDGKEGYTRAGNFRLNQDGLLTSSRGNLILGIDGPITVPQAKRVSINKDGAVLALPIGETEKDIVEVGRLKLVKPDVTKLIKGEDGMFYINGEGQSEASDSVNLVPEFLEGSNIDAVRTLVDLIDVSRRFEFHGKLAKSVDDKGFSCNSLLKDLV